MNSLCLVEYSSSGDSEEEDATHSLPNYVKSDDVPDKKILGGKLPVPRDIQVLFSQKKSNLSDDPTQHEGRIRTFPHEQGNWATSVYIPTDFADDEDFLKLQEQLFLCLKPLEFHKTDECHISLSRTVGIRHHWIQELKQTLEKQFSKALPCACEIDGVKVYVNDERTRSFLGLQVTATDERLQDYVEVVDECFEGYKLAKYYKPPSFHISIGWCLGDVSERIDKKTEEKMKEVLNICITELDDGGYFSVEKIVLKTGNKEFGFTLSSRK